MSVVSAVSAGAPAGAPHLLVFARAPQAGRVKTRLCPPLAPEEAAALHEALVRDVVARHQRPGRRCTLWRADDTPHPLWDTLRAAHPYLAFATQPATDLGGRMAHALACALAEDPAAPVVIVGADSPTLPPSLVDAAFEALGHRAAVLGPALDGGYYLVGARGAVPPIFAGPRWGEASVLATTLALAAAAGCRPALLPWWYDLDRPEDLDRLGAHLPLLAEADRPAATAAWWARWTQTSYPAPGSPIAPSSPGEGRP